MPRGSTDGSIRHVDATADSREHWVVRKRYTDLKGRKCEKKRIVYTEFKANRAMREIENEIAGELASISTPTLTRTVSDVVTYCKEHQFKPAVYSGETKIAGQRTWNKTWSALKPVEAFFGSMAVAAVSSDDLDEYKELRLTTPVVTARVRYDLVDGKRMRVEYFDSRPRSLACVDRELSWFKAVLSIALQKKWVIETPFAHSHRLIETSLEPKHERVLTFDEERRLFAACKGSAKRAHLPFAMTMALETWLRMGEQFRLDREKDVNIEGRLISALSYKGKRARRRLIYISDALLPDLVAHLATTTGPGVFDYKDPGKAFESACRDAGIEGVTWHTLRHTGITRAVHVYKIPPIDVMKLSGHTVWKTFFETYVNIDEDMTRAIGEGIDAARAQVESVLPKPAEIEASNLVN